MFPPLRMNTLFPITPRETGDTVESLYNRFNNLTDTGYRPDINPALTNRINTPINKFAPPYTTNNEIPHGLTPANPQLESRFVGNSISPLDIAKLNQNEEKIKNAAGNNLSNLNFKQTKQEEDNAVRNNRAAIYKFKAENPGMKFDYSGPNVIVSDPISGKSHDTGVPTGHLSDSDKINLNSTDRINEIGTRANEARNTNTRNNNERSNNELNNIAARGNETRKTNNTKSISETQQNQGYLNKANSLVNSDPKYKNYITIKTNSDGKPVGFTINPPKNGMGSDDPTYHEVNAKIYGSQSNDISIPTNDQNKPDSTKTTNKDTKSSAFNSSTTKRYLDKAGNKYDIPMDKIDLFLKDHPDAESVESR